jgi:hypothetical protein
MNTTKLSLLIGTLSLLMSFAQADVIGIRPIPRPGPHPVPHPVPNPYPYPYPIPGPIGRIDLRQDRMFIREAMSLARLGRMNFAAVKIQQVQNDISQLPPSHQKHRLQNILSSMRSALMGGFGHHYGNLAQVEYHGEQAIQVINELIHGVANPYPVPSYELNRVLDLVPQVIQQVDYSDIYGADRTLIEMDRLVRQALQREPYDSELNRALAILSNTRSQVYNNYLPLHQKQRIIRDCMQDLQETIYRAQRL